MVSWGGLGLMACIYIVVNNYIRKKIIQHKQGLQISQEQQSSKLLAEVVTAKCKVFRKLNSGSQAIARQVWYVIIMALF